MIAKGLMTVHIIHIGDNDKIKIQIGILMRNCSMHAFFFDDSINFCETSCMHHIIAQYSAVVVGYQNCVGSSVDSLSFILYRINVKKLLQSL